MKHISYSFSRSDIEVILFTLTVFPTLKIDEPESQTAINLQCCCSAGKKLINHDINLVPNEFRVIYASLLGAQLINQCEIKVSEDIRKKCNSYSFTINKLLSIFDEQMS